MLALETKQSGGKLLPHSDLPGVGGVSRGNIVQHTKRVENRKLDVVGMQEVRWDKGVTVRLL